MTKQKEAILGMVKNMTNHPTADEIYECLKKEAPRLSLGTVYRNLNTLSDCGDIRKVSVPGFGNRFDFRLDDHEHFLCENCGRVFDADVKVDIVPTDPRAKITGYTLMLNGICADCAE